MSVKTLSGIDKSNDSLWQSRFDNSVKVAADATKILKKAEKAGYTRGIAYANLNIAAGNFLQSKSDIALKHLTVSFQWFENNKKEKGYVRALLLKGNIFESFGDYEKTLNFWLEAYKKSVEISDIESEGESCSQLGLIYSRLCNFQKALEYFNKGLMIREELGDENATASSLNRIGMVLRQTKKYEESLEYYFRSLEIRKKNNQLSAIPWTLLGIANTYEDMKRYPESLDYYEKGIKGGDKRCTMQCMMGAGRIYSRTGDAAHAEKRLEQSLLMAQELNSMVLIAEAHSALATHYELFKKPDKALKSFKQYLKARETFQSNEVQSKLSNIEVAHAVEKSEQEKEIYRLRHVELKSAYDIIEEKNKDITASINYASRIQRAMLPGPSEIKGFSSKSFILYLPKDIVSGDFYWFSEIKSKLILVAGDCTGHGVPGALMSMLGISFLEEIVNEREITESGQILNELRKEVQRALHQKGIREEAKDGMDIALCVIDRSKKTIQFSGAYNSLYLIRMGELIEYPADRMPIGIFDLSDKGFSSQDISFLPGDIIYMFSDGYADQFGGPNNKKFKNSALKELLTKIHGLPLKEQKKRLESEFLKWKGDNPQTDDVLVIGMKLLLYNFFSVSLCGPPWISV
ncbi:MAG TPA: tetratricopeptide repeat protein [Bacteroidales bacterium]|nr:tetratricopeptide repeat protein [Bacteroidales bacterium]